jgi:hypothetical protein
MNQYYLRRTRPSTTLIEGRPVDCIDVRFADNISDPRRRGTEELS